MPHHVFLSYSRNDAEMMMRVRRDLGTAGLDVWKSENLTHGTAAWHKAVEKAINQSRCMVVIFSPNAKQSDWIKRQLVQARDHNKRIFPILVEGDEASAIPSELGDTPFIDLRADYTSGLVRLVEALYTHLNIQSSVPRQLTVPTESPSQTIQTSTTRSARPNLHEGEDMSLSVSKPWNPIHQAELLGWLIENPARYLDYQKQVGKKEAKKATAWLMSTLICLPFLIPALGIQLGLTPTPNTGTIAESFPTWVVVMSVGWLIINFETSPHDRQNISDNILRGIIAILIVSGVAISLAFGLAGIMAGGIALAIVLTVAMILSLEVAPGLTFYVVMGIALGIIIGGLINSHDGALLGVSVTFGFLAGLLFLMPMVRGVMLTTKRPFRMRAIPGGKPLLVVIFLAYSVLIWIYWLGGWRALGS